MAYNTKALKTDTNTDKIPQFFSVAAEDYYALLGTANVGPHYIQFDTSGDELFTSTNPGRVAVENPTGESLDVQVTGSNVVNADVQNVTTAGTRVQLPSITCREITLIGKRANTGYIYVGGSDVSDTVYGAELAALDSITIAVENANMLYIDASVSGEGISYVTV